MKKVWQVVSFCALLVSFIAGPVKADPPATDADLQQQIQNLQTQLNQLEVETEGLKGQSQQAQKPIVSLAGGSLEQDFESNSDSWSILQGQTLNLKFLADPAPNVTGHFDLFFLGKVAPDILHYSYLPVLSSENIFFVLKEADVTFNSGLLSFRAFTGLAHDGFYNTDDDFYYLFPAMNDVDTPWRVSGRPVPTGMEIQGKNDLDGLDIWAGQELVWGAGQQVYAKYKHNIGTTTFGVIDKIQLPLINAFSEGTTYAPAVTVTSYVSAPKNTVEAFWKVPISDVLLWENVGVYNPANVNQPYTYSLPVAAGTGTAGSSYQVYQGTTSQTDALGYQVKLTTHAIPGLDSVMVNGEYSGLLADDLERISGEIIETPAPFCTFTFDATAQKPLIGPNPLVYNGDQGGGVGTLIQPRSEGDPFRVTLDPISGINNREMTKFSLSFVFNNGDGWFFKYNPNVFDSYNVNMDLNTDFSTGIIGTLFNYPTSTDLTSYVNQAGILTWEGAGSLGQPATDGYLPFVHWVTMWKTDNLHWVADLQGGYSTAILGYTSTNGHSSTDLFQGNLTARINDTSLTFGYGQNVWGPEFWDQQFGLTIGRLYTAILAQKFGQSQVSLKYESWSNLPGDPYSIPNLNGVNLPIEELYATYTLNF